MSAPLPVYEHPRVEMPRRYYLPATRPQQPGPVAVRAQQPSAPQEPAAPRRRLPVFRAEESAEVTAARAALYAAVAKALPPVPAESDPTTVRPRQTTGRVRPVTVAAKRISHRAIAQAQEVYPLEEHTFGEGRPRSYELCTKIGLGSVIPCPFVSCRSHLYVDVNPANGSIRVSRPDLDPTDLPETCGRRLMDQGGLTLESLGDGMNVTRERIRQLEMLALAELRRVRPARRALRDLDR